MSGRWSLDGDDDRWLDGEALTAICTDCGAGFARAAIDVRTLCDACCDQRDAWTSALELTLAQVATPHHILQVAIVPVDPDAPLSPVVEVRLEPARAAAAVRLADGKPDVSPRAMFLERLPTLSAVQQSRAYKPIPKKQPTRRKEVA